MKFIDLITLFVLPAVIAAEYVHMCKTRRKNVLVNPVGPVNLDQTAPDFPLRCANLYCDSRQLTCKDPFRVPGFASRTFNNNIIIIIVN